MLEVRTVGPDDALATVVLCHGFGADEADLVPMAGGIATNTPVRFVFPRAPHAFPAAWGAGRAWFPDTEQELAAFVAGEMFAHLDQLDPPSLADAGAMLTTSLGALGSGEARARQPGGERRRLIVGGFSQGAMVACEAMLAAGLQADGLVVLSGALIAAARWRSIAESRPLAGVPVLQAHGDADRVLACDSGVRLGRTLDIAGAERTFVPFAGGHGIPRQVLDRLSSWIDALCSTPP